jgi:signal transduction histidine kinase
VGLGYEKGNNFMKIEISEIAFLLVVTTALFVFLILLLIGFFVLYQKRKDKVKRDIAEQQANFDKEILNTQTEIREETMMFISQELHDNIAQTLVVTHLTLNRLDDEKPELIQAKIALQHTINQVKLLSKALNTDNLLSGGLIGGLNFEINRLKQLERWDIDFVNEIDSLEIAESRQLLIFRIFQELINNIIKYGQAKSIFIELTENEASLNLKLIDDGNQFDFHALAMETGFKAGAGLKGVIKKAELLKANLDVYVNKNKGMTYDLTLPKWI